MSVRRVSVHAERGGEAVLVDLALPCAVSVAELLPEVVAVMGVDPGTRGWRLQRVAGDALDPEATLSDGDVRDGDVLLLTACDPGPPAVRTPAPHRVIASAARTPTAWRGSDVSITVCAWVAAAVLVWPGAAVPPLVGAALAALGALSITGVGLAGRRYAVLPAVAPLTAAGGVLAVPGPFSAADVFLAAAGVAAGGLIASRFAPEPSAAPWAIAVAGALTAAVTVTAMPVRAAAVAAAVAALALLVAAPRITAAGLSSGAAAPLPGRAGSARLLLGGLLVGSVVTAAAASVVLVIAAATGHAGTAATVAFSAAIGAALALRARHVADHAVPLVVAGTCCALAGLALLVLTGPAGSRPWIAAAVVASGCLATRRIDVGDAGGRALDWLEYAALGAVPALGCWAAGLLELIRQASP